MTPLPTTFSRAATITVAVSVLVCASALATGCMPIDASPSAVEPASAPVEQLLVGTWAWQPDISVIAIDDSLHATQWSSLAAPGSADADYQMSWLDDRVLMMEGYFSAHEECALLQRCDRGRLAQVHFITSYVDADVFLPYALLRQSSGAGVAGVYEASGLRFDRLGPGSGADGDLVFMWLDTWRIGLDDSGRYTALSTRTWYADISDPSRPVALAQSYDEDLSAHAGTWRLVGDRLHLTADDGDAYTHLYRAGALSLDSLIFERQ